jgi:hypothetical protein
MPPFRSSAALASTGLLLAGLAPARAGTLVDALTEGTVVIDARYRYEHVDQQGFSEDARASTGRLRLGYGTEAWHDVAAYFEFEALRSIGGQTYNSTQNGNTQYPTVADPEDEEINQAFLSYAAPRKTRVKLGRQRIKLGNDRFVGNVGWRQLEQTFDALSVRSEPTERLAVFAGYLNNANRIFGEHNPVPTSADLDLETYLLETYVRVRPGTVTAYAHFLENQDVSTASHQNLGVRFAGRHAASDRLAWVYAVEYADQRDYEGAPSTVDADYGLLEAGVEPGPWSFKASYERLGGDGTYGFQTPLATLHSFQGWADRFASGTPAAGIEDLYVTVSRRIGGYGLTAVYHDFAADSGGFDYGSEIDALATKTWGKVDFMLKFADYRADVAPPAPLPPYALDTRIVWFMMEWRTGA